MNQRYEYRNQKILKHANEQTCQNCGKQNNTVVAAHSNLSEHGKGKGIKSHDLFVAFLCQDCHAWLDQGSGPDPTGIWRSDREDKREMFMRAMHKTQLILVHDEILK